MATIFIEKWLRWKKEKRAIVFALRRFSAAKKVKHVRFFLDSKESHLFLNIISSISSMMLVPIVPRQLMIVDIHINGCDNQKVHGAWAKNHANIHRSDHYNTATARTSSIYASTITQFSCSNPGTIAFLLPNHTKRLILCFPVCYIEHLAMEKINYRMSRKKTSSLNAPSYESRQKKTIFGKSVFI